MEKYLQKYQTWLEYPSLSQEMKKELEDLSKEENAILDAFYQDLSFGTAGLRGKMGVGSNRMNVYTVARASVALAEEILQHDNKSIVIGYDCRNNSRFFAEICARIMANYGVVTYFFDSLRPTPEISFALRHLNTLSAVNITASHNPREYNGFKVYWYPGSQIKSTIADQIATRMDQTPIFTDLQKLPSLSEMIEAKKVILIGSEVDQAFYQEVLQCALRPNIDKKIKIVYTPLFGAGKIPVTEVLTRLGYQFHLVAEESIFSGDFDGVPYPNPEVLSVYERARTLAKEVVADLILATDPDADRLGVQVLHQGQMIPLTGNQVGVLLANYLLESLHSSGKLLKNSVIVKSIVSTKLIDKIARDYQVDTVDVLIGFKNICEIANKLEHSPTQHYLFGFEESVGYHYGSFLRDKDGVTAAVLMAEACAYYRLQGKTLYDVLETLYQKYGYHLEKSTSIVLEGSAGAERIKRMMAEFRRSFPRKIEDIIAVTKTDYLTQEVVSLIDGKVDNTSVEVTDAISITYNDGSWYTLRPSGTEPKIKLYVYAQGETREQAQKTIDTIFKQVLTYLHQID